MSTPVETVVAAAPRDVVPLRRDYLNASYTVRSWLLTTDHKLYAIARACGFQGAQQLTRVFTREVGISPRQYRKRGGPLAP